MTAIIKHVKNTNDDMGIFLECLIKTTKAAVNVVGTGQHFSPALYEKKR
jgi:hypothetical protein